MVPTIEAAGLHEKRRGDRTAINFPESAPRRATRPPYKAVVPKLDQGAGKS